MQGGVREETGTHKNYLSGIASPMERGLTAHAHGDQAHLPFSFNTGPILISIAGFARTFAVESLPGMFPSLQKFLLDSSILENIILFRIAGGFWIGLKQSKGELEIRSI